MTSKSIEGSITKTYINKLRLHCGVYELINYEGIISNDGPNLFYPILKIINPAARFGISNLKDDIEKKTLAKFDNNVKDVLGDM